MSNQTLFKKAQAIQQASDQETPMRTLRFSSVLPVLAVGMLAVTANATVLLQEDFNYTPGVYTSVAGGGGWGNSFPGITQGAVGFTSDWSWNAAGSELGIGAADANHTDGAYYDGSRTGGAVALFNIALPSLTPVYQSMLFGQTGANSGNFILRSAGGWGFATVGVNGAGNYALTVGGSTVTTTIPVSATGFDQILMDFTRANQDVFGNVTVNLWVNPNWSSLGTPSASVTASTAYANIQELLMQGGGVTVDRIRIGTTLADVQINPEPNGSAFDTWAGTGTGGKGLTGTAAAFDADPDYDGITNGIEFVIGGEPNPANPGSNSSALLPTAAASGTNLVFTHTRTHAAAYLNPFVEFDADMQGAWTTATSGNATIAVVTGSTADTVIVTIPKGSNSKLFARLKVVNTP
jgi:hypothetical protein